MMNWKIGSINLIYFLQSTSRAATLCVCHGPIVRWSKTKTIFHRILRVRCRSDIKRNETASDCEIANTRMGSTERRSLHDSSEIYDENADEARLTVEGVESVFGWNILTPQWSRSFIFRWAKIIVWNMIFSIFYNDRRCCNNEWWGRYTGSNYRNYDRTSDCTSKTHVFIQ